MWFFNQVKPGGPWDYKTQGSQYDPFGNFNYGATGNVIGFSQGALLDAAAGLKWYNLLIGDPAGNPGLQPQKAQEIVAGYQYYQNGCDGTTKSQ